MQISTPHHLNISPPFINKLQYTLVVDNNACVVATVRGIAVSILVGYVEQNLVHAVLVLAHSERAIVRHIAIAVTGCIRLQLDAASVVLDVYNLLLTDVRKFNLAGLMRSLPTFTSTLSDDVLPSPSGIR